MTPRKFMDAGTRRERNFVLLFLGLASLVLAHFVYVAWFNYAAFAPAADPKHDLFAGTDYAPNQYRLAMPYLAAFFDHVFHVTRNAATFAIFDFLAAYGAMYLLYLRLVGGQWVAGIDHRSRLLVVGFFLAALQFPLAWVVAWQRPETLPTAAYVAGCLLLISRFKEQSWGWIAFFVLTLWQSFVRTDVPVVLGIAMILVGLFSRSQGMQRRRWKLAGCGVVVFGIASATQVYLQFFLFPHAVYPPDTAVFMLPANFSTHNLSIFAIALAPCAALLLLIPKVATKLDEVDWITLLASLLYLPLWFTVGVVSEVRIFVPFFLALCPVAAKAFYWVFSTEDPDAVASALKT